ncbi:MAG: hypothetical protein JWO03_512 [Bacteroidetes bacterium]|nr:hypothetical protein [Bacteroidota bacterium]
MKKVLLFAIVFSLFSVATYAQHCAAATNSVTPHTASGSPGFSPSTDRIPCIDSATNVSDTLYFENFTTISGLPVDFVRFDSIENLPAGLCWTTNVANNTYTAGQTGAILISGRCIAPRGQYKLRIIVSASAGGGAFPFPNQNLETLSANFFPPAIRYYLRVKCASANCPALDTVNGATNPFIAYTTASCATSTLTATITPSGATTFCQGDSVILTAGPAGSTYFWNTPSSARAITVKTSGTYTVTVTNGGNSATASVVVTMKPSATKTVNASVCSGSSYTVGGQSFNTGGAHVVTLSGAAANGCDSVITLNLTIKQAATKTITTSICQGSSYTVGGQSFNTSGPHVVTLTGGAANGCDSTITLNLTIKQPSTRTITTSVCQGSSYTIGGQSFNTAGAHVVTLTGGAANGCDSTITLNLSIKQPSTNTINTAVCQGSSYTVGSQSFNTAGPHVVTLTGAATNGCDSTITLNLTIKQPATRTINASVCQGSSYTVGTQSFNTAGPHTVTLTGAAANGCDSIITLNLTLKQPAVNAITASICQGSSYTIGSQSFNTAGPHTVTLTGAAANGCDSIINLNLSINTFASTTLNQSICTGGSYHFGTQNLTTAGTYVDSLHAAGGCDSIVTLHLTVKTPATSTITAGICTGSSYTVGTQSFATSGNYNVTINGGSVNGCDSTVTLHLTVSSFASTSLTDTICAGTSYTFGSQVLTAAGTFVDSLHAVGGCDSIVTLSLAVIAKPAPVASILGNSVVTSPSFTSYQWLVDNTIIPGADSVTHTVTQTGYYRVIVSNANGCVDTSAPVYYMIIGINEASNTSAVKLYPNPNNGSFVLETMEAQEYIVSDMLGRIVGRQPVTADRQSIKLSDITGGSYILTVLGGSGSVRIPFVISR